MAIRIEIEGLAEFQGRLGAMGSGLNQDVTQALTEAAQLVAEGAQSRAPRRTGRLRGSIAVFTEESTAGVAVTARRVSRRYPGGFPYPAKIERGHPFLAPTVVAESKRIEDRMTRVLDELATKWGGG